MVGFLMIAFTAAIGLNWPELPYNARLADLIFVPLAISVIATRVPRMAWHRSDTAVALYLLGSLPAILVSADQRHSALEFVRQLYLVAIYAVCAIVSRRNLGPFIGSGLGTGAFALTLLGLYFVGTHSLFGDAWPLIGEVMTLPYVGSVLRVRALTASEAMFACLLTAAVPFVLHSTDRPTARRRWHALMMIAAAALTFSHAIAGLAVALVIVMWPSMTRWPRRIAVAAALVISIGLNVAATASIKSLSYGAANYSDASQYHYAVDQKEFNLGDLHVTYNVMSYARIKQVAWRAFIEHPVAGVGLDQFHVETQRAFEEGRLTADYREIDPHSTLPGRFAEAGVIGGMTLLFLWFVWARMAIDAARSSYLALAGAAALAGLAVASINADIMNFRFLWVIAGLLRGLQDAKGMAIASGRDDTATRGDD